MRQIKFSVWDPTRKKIIKGESDLVLKNGVFKAKIVQELEGESPIKRAILLQNTGVRDNEDNDINEGHILKYMTGQGEKIGYVHYEGQAGAFNISHLIKGERVSGPYFTSLFSPDEKEAIWDLKIVGNFFTNKEILEQ